MYCKFSDFTNKVTNNIEFYTKDEYECSICKYLSDHATNGASIINRKIRCSRYPKCVEKIKCPKCNHLEGRKRCAGYPKCVEKSTF